MKFFVLICICMLLTGCATENTDESMEMTEVLTQTVLPEEIYNPEPEIPETTVPELELFSPLVQPEDSDIVRVTDYIPDIIVDLKYSTDDNFTGKRVYDFKDVFLRYGTVMKLKSAAEEAQSMACT